MAYISSSTFSVERAIACRALFVSASILALGLAAPSKAQTASPDTEAEVAPDEIIVTANKREQRLSDVGLAIQAISADALQSQKVSSLADFAALVPGLSYTPTSQSTPVYTLRGVGFYESSLPNYPSVSMYQDEVPLPFPAMTAHAVFDLERVEVLKGPQGTLYGQNATAGAINLIAAKPTDTFKAGIEAGYSRFNRVEGTGFISGPLSSTVRARIAVSGVDSDGWQKSYTRSDRLGATKFIVGRALVDWDPSSNFSVKLSFNGWQDKSDPQAPQLQSLLPQSPGTFNPAIQNYPFPARKPRLADWSPQSRPFANNRLMQGAIRLDWKFYDDIALTSISSYAVYKQKQRVERDGTTFLVDDIALDTGKIDTFSQELRIGNGGAQKFRWVLGGNFETSDVFEEARSIFPDISTAPIFGYTGGKSSTDQKLRNYAAFGNIELEPSEGLTIKAGLRYTQANRTATACTRDPGDGSFAPVFDSLANAIQLGFIPLPGFTPSGIPVPPIGNGCAALDNVTSDGTPVTYLPGAYTTKLNQHNLSWRAGVDYKATPSLLLYANLAKGYKAGSIPLASAATFAQYQSVTQESLMSYEAGFKYQSDDRRFSMNGAVFYYDYTNKQLRSKIVDPIFGLLDALANVPKSRLIGVEGDILYHPIDGLALSMNASYIDSKIQKFSGFSASGQLTDFAGATIPYTPKFQLSGTLDYSWTMGSISPFVGASVVARTDSLANIGGDRGFIPLPSYRSSVPVGETFKVPGYATFDLRAGIEIDAWKVTIFAKNVTNKYYLTNVYTQYDTINRLTGMPRTYGITIGYKFD